MQRFFALPCYQFSGFYILKNAYIVPAKPTKPAAKLKTHVFRVWKQEQPELKESALNQQFNSLDAQKLQEFEQLYAKTKQDYQKQVLKWEEKYSVPKRPVNAYIMQTEEIRKQHAEELKGLTFVERAKKVNEIAKATQLSEAEKAAAAARVKEANDEYQKVMTQYRAKYGLPKSKISTAYNQFVAENIQKDKKLADVSQKYKEISEEEKAELQRRVDLLNADWNKQWEQLAKEYKMSREELQAEVRRQLKQ